MKRILIAVALFATLGAAQAQQQTGVLNTQFRLQGQQKTLDLDTAQYINFAQNDPYVIDYDGVRHNGSFSLSKIQANPLWKNYVQSPSNVFLYVNTKYVNFACVNSQTVAKRTGRATEAINDNCALQTRIISQSDTN